MCTTINFFLILIISFCNIVVFCYGNYNSPREWTGRWFPQPPDKLVDDNPSVEYVSKSKLHDNKHGIQMGVLSADCDDAKTNLTVDWDESPDSYICFEDKTDYLPNRSTYPVLSCDDIPVGYSVRNPELDNSYVWIALHTLVILFADLKFREFLSSIYNAQPAIHKCMDTPIEYDEIVPTFGTHRPLWPKYGEYGFVPKQRWLHNLEHGAIVMLYHPCANKNEVQLLKKIIKGCLYRHIITPYNLLPKERPLALVSWGCRLLMSKVHPEIVTGFIRKYALHGPEAVSRDGQYSYNILQHANLVSNEKDVNLCPSFNLNSMK